MKFPKQVKAVAVFIDENHQRNFSRSQLEEAKKFIEENEQEGIAIFWFRTTRPTQLYAAGTWTNYTGTAKPPKFRIGRPATGQGTTAYVPARLAAIVVALETADESQLRSIQQILSTP